MFSKGEVRWVKEVHRQTTYQPIEPHTSPAVRSFQHALSNTLTSPRIRIATMKFLGNITNSGFYSTLVFGAHSTVVHDGSSPILWSKAE